MILLDSSALIDSLAGPRRSEPALRKAIEAGEILRLPALVLYEWLRGPRTHAELAAQRQLFPDELAIPYQFEDARLSAKLFQSLKRARQRQIDLAIAAGAIRHEAHLWTLNPADFSDIPGLSLWQAA